MHQYRINICTANLDNPKESDIAKTEFVVAPDTDEAERKAQELARSVPNAIGYQIKDLTDRPVALRDIS